MYCTCCANFKHVRAILTVLILQRDFTTYFHCLMYFLLLLLLHIYWFQFIVIRYNTQQYKYLCCSDYLFSDSIHVCVCVCLLLSSRFIDNYRFHLRWVNSSGQKESNARTYSSNEHITLWAATVNVILSFSFAFGCSGLLFSIHFSYRSAISWSQFITISVRFHYYLITTKTKKKILFNLFFRFRNLFIGSKSLIVVAFICFFFCFSPILCAGFVCVVFCASFSYFFSFTFNLL